MKNYRWQKYWTLTSWRCFSDFDSNTFNNHYMAGTDQKNTMKCIERHWPINFGTIVVAGNQHVTISVSVDNGLESHTNHKKLTLHNRCLLISKKWKILRLLSWSKWRNHFLSFVFIEILCFKAYFLMSFYTNNFAWL